MPDESDKRTILVVDDDGDIREVLRLLFERRGFDVREAANGVEALEELGRELPSAMLLDMMMPVMSGPEVLDRMRGDARLSHVPVLLVTAWPRQAAELPGARAVVSKPVDIRELTQELEQVLR